MIQCGMLAEESSILLLKCLWVRMRRIKRLVAFKL